MSNLEKYRNLESRIGSLPGTAKQEHALLSMELKVVASKLTRLEKWKVEKGVL